MLDMSWREVRILVAAVVCAMLFWAVLRGIGGVSWEATLAVMVASATIVQWIGCGRALRTRMRNEG